MPTLPNAALAVVPDEKLSGYLLDPDHPRGGSKARFLERFGFRRDALDALREALIRHALDNELGAATPTAYGTRFEVDGALVAPDGRAPMVRVVWFLRTGEVEPRLVTLVPRRMAAS